ncbi:MAG: S-methyl-5-thioribose-1-phosphate isomerase [Saprospiraceae bacterium]|nr:S-methyl-5-thioribose-1-phosphate isomerase [Saprospiraceae bacterium]
MNVNGKHFRTIWVKEADNECIQIIDQRSLPHNFVIEDIRTVQQMATAIKDMHVRGAGLIGAAAAYGMYLAALQSANSNSFDDDIQNAANNLLATRPTAVNLSRAVEKQIKAINKAQDIYQKIQASLRTAQDISNEDAKFCKEIGFNGLDLIKEISYKKEGQTVNILTHCNAGWLAFVDYGSATAPIYAAFDAGVDVHVWVDETRPRNQGARLTAWELLQHGVPHTVITDNVGGHLMQHNMVDLVLTGTDRTTYTGDVCNKIGTYLKALAAKDNDVPFYVALPSSSIDWDIENGIQEIPIEERDATEVQHIQGLLKGEIKNVQLTPEKSPAANYAFDVTPANLVTGLITERGICEASEKGIKSLFPKQS